jgi:hypothetical protein
MSQRVSGYKRLARDAYYTPAWPTLALIPHLPAGITKIWESCGDQDGMATPLRHAGFEVTATDIVDGIDFFQCTSAHNYPRTIVMNPAYYDAQRFIEHALTIADIIAVLLMVDFDSAVTRRHLFADCPAFASKIVLLHRIRWFPDSTGSPSFNHAWFLWNRAHVGAPRISYAVDSTRRVA